MELSEYKKIFNEDDASPGWDCIDQRLSQVYGDKEPRHFAAVPHYALGGENPLDGISAYLSKNGGILHEHVVTYGFSELYYDEEAVGGEYSKYGFELTFRLKVEKENEDIHWAINFLQNIAKYVFKTGNYFDDFHYMPANGPIRLEYDTRIHALGFLTDKDLGEIETPHGKVKFLQVIGLTQKEYDAVRNKKRKLDDIFEKLSIGNPLLVTDLDRGET
jgi:hypothetical protein